jgi:hypothetical protein
MDAAEVTGLTLQVAQPAADLVMHLIAGLREVALGPVPRDPGDRRLDAVPVAAAAGVKEGRPAG